MIDIPQCQNQKTESDESDEDPATEIVRDENFSEDEGSASDESYMSDDFENICIVKPPEVLELALSVLQGPVNTFLQNEHVGYTIWVDNLDKNVHRRHMRLDHATESPHFFHMHAVENHIDFKMLSDVSRTHLNLSEARTIAESLLPTQLDDEILKKNISTLISRVLCTHLDEL